MPSLAGVLKAEVRRHVARDTSRSVRLLSRIQKQLKALRSAAREQRRALAGIARRLRRLGARGAARFRGPGRGGEGASGLSPQAIHSLRRRLGMSRLKFAKLVGVSPGSIFGWEKGRTIPRSRSLARVLAVRRLGVEKARARIKAPLAAKRGTRGRRGRRRARA